MNQDFLIRKMKSSDWEMVATIYKQGIATKNATFETACPSWEEWNRKRLPICRLVATIKKKVVGWIVLSPTSSRVVFKGVVEVSIYVDNEHQGQGIGKALFKSLICESEKKNIWMIQAGIFRENKSSIALHKKMGFRIVGYRENIGKMNRIWRDILLLERRSSLVGT